MLFSVVETLAASNYSCLPTWFIEIWVKWGIHIWVTLGICHDISAFEEFVHQSVYDGIRMKKWEI